MSKQHFAAIASVLASVRDTLSAGVESDASEALDLTAEQLADVFAGFNGRFDRDRFLAAAGHPDFTN